MNPPTMKGGFVMPEKCEPGHPRYLKILDQMRELHIKKDQDYEGDSKPFDNFRSAVEIGIKPSTGAFIRLQDKFKRIQNLLMRENRGVGAAVKDESIEDTLLDLASYSLIVLVLRGEESGLTRLDTPEKVLAHMGRESITKEQLSAEIRALAQRQMNAPSQPGLQAQMNQQAQVPIQCYHDWFEGNLCSKCGVARK